MRRASRSEPYAFCRRRRPLRTDVAPSTLLATTRRKDDTPSVSDARSVTLAGAVAAEVKVNVGTADVAMPDANVAIATPVPDSAPPATALESVSVTALANVVPP